MGSNANARLYRARSRGSGRYRRTEKLHWKLCPIMDAPMLPNSHRHVTWSHSRRTCSVFSAHTIQSARINYFTTTKTPQTSYLLRWEPRRWLELQVAEFALDLLCGTFETKFQSLVTCEPSACQHWLVWTVAVIHNFPFTVQKQSDATLHHALDSGHIHWPVLRCVTSLLGPLVIVYIMWAPVTSRNSVVSVL